ncbi:hypothetical protein F5X99DRAFT_366156 [Biscogniauxia marginata]|nr:hypothetical protein F5X99DRAFT_366156 [Biscogniauxia marginata]
MSEGSRATDSSQVGPGISLLGVLEKFQHHLKTTPNFIVHPFMVANLRLLVKIAGEQYMSAGSRASDSDKNVARSILEVLLKLSGTSKTVDVKNTWAFVSSQSAGETSLRKSAQAISVEYELANILLSSASIPSQLDTAIDILTGVVKDRENLLGEHHIDTLTAQRSQVFAKYLKLLQQQPNSMDEMKPLLFQSQLDINFVVNKFELRYGIHHPGALWARLGRLVISLAYQPDDLQQIEKECRFLYQRLSDTQVTTERFVEAQLMKLDVVTQLEEKNRSIALELAKDMLSDIGREASVNREYKNSDTLNKLASLLYLRYIWDNERPSEWSRHSDDAE